MRAHNPATNTAIIDQVDAIIHSPESLQEFISAQFSKNSTYKPSRSMRVCLHLLAHIQIGQLDLILPDNSTLRFGAKSDGPKAYLRMHNDRVAKRFLVGGQLAFCEAYLDGDWSSPDLTQFFELIQRNAQSMQNKLMGKKLMRMISYINHIMKPNSKRGSRKNIYSHYDIGNDFYAQWLDPSMTYSAALFTNGVTDLEQAQNQKYKEIATRLDLKPEHHVLEIGCGWGGFAEYAAKNIGCKMTCITVSPAQYEYASNRIEKAGLSDKVEIRLQDYRDVQGQFDRIASIEMFEAVGEAYWPTFFNTIKDRLKSDGRATLQIITISDSDFPTYRKNADYIQRYIFPGGMLPSMTALSEQINAAGLTQKGHLSFGKDYAKTLNLWNDAFQTAWPNIQSQKLDMRFKRLWEQYLCYCESGFNTGSIDVIQISIDKP